MHVFVPAGSATLVPGQSTHTPLFTIWFGTPAAFVPVHELGHTKNKSTTIVTGSNTGVEPGGFPGGFVTALL